MNPVGVKSRTYIDIGIENNDKKSKFKVGDYVRISNQKNIFAKGYTPNQSEEVFVIKKVKNIVRWACVICDLNGKETVGTFYEKTLQNNKPNRVQSKKGDQEKKVRNQMLNGKTTILFTVGLIKIMLFYKMSYLLESYTRNKSQINLNQIWQTMQQNLTDKVQEVPIYQNLLINKKIVLSGLK